MGRTTAGTARLIDDPDALRFEAFPPDSAITEHYRKSIDRKDMDGVSFRFYKLADNWTGAGEATVREVTEADIDDVSVVTFPAYGDTIAVTRSIDEHCRSQSRPATWRKGALMRLRLAEAATK